MKDKVEEEEDMIEIPDDPFYPCPEIPTILESFGKNVGFRSNLRPLLPGLFEGEEGDNIHRGPPEHGPLQAPQDPRVRQEEHL